jgi:inositol 1,4,5-triphosphate receptor type 1
MVLCAAKLLSRAGRSLHEVQSHLDKEGASDLVVELVIKSVHSPSIFVEAVELGIALLEGGNPIIQKSMYSKLMGGDLSQAFFKVSGFCNHVVKIEIYYFREASIQSYY